MFGIPQGLNSLALQNAVYHQADSESIGASAGLLRTFGYLGAITSAAAHGPLYGEHADTGGMHHLVVFLLVVASVLLLNVLDPLLSRLTHAKRRG